MYIKLSETVWKSTLKSVYSVTGSEALKKREISNGKKSYFSVPLNTRTISLLLYVVDNDYL